MAVSPFPRYWATKEDGQWYGNVQLTEDGDPITSPACKTKGGAMNIILNLHPRVCACGCAEETRGGEFRMGHDARHKSNLIKEALADNADALAEIERRGWLTHLDKAREIAERPAKEPTVRRQEQTESDEEKALKAHDRIRIMKAACSVLKSMGQYTRDSGMQIRIDSIEEAARIIEGAHADLVATPGEAEWEEFTPEWIGALERNHGLFFPGTDFITWLEGR